MTVRVTLRVARETSSKAKSKKTPRVAREVSSIVATMRNLGQSSSMAILTIVIGMHLGNIPLENAGTSELLATIKTSFLIFVVLCIAGMLMSLKSGSEKIKD